jgi:hypothetical protein
MVNLGSLSGAACCHPIELPPYQAAPLQTLGMDAVVFIRRTSTKRLVSNRVHGTAQIRRGVADGGCYVLGAPRSSPHLSLVPPDLRPSEGGIGLTPSLI